MHKLDTAQQYYYAKFVKSQCLQKLNHFVERNTKSTLDLQIVFDACVAEHLMAQQFSQCLELEEKKKKTTKNNTEEIVVQDKPYNGATVSACLTKNEGILQGILAKATRSFIPKKEEFIKIIESSADAEFEPYENETELIALRCAKSWQTCDTVYQQMKQKCGAQYTGENALQGELECVKSMIEYDHCFASNTCYNELKKCMLNQPKALSMDESFIACNEHDDSVLHCKQDAYDVNDKLKFAVAQREQEQAYVPWMQKHIQEQPSFDPLTSSTQEYEKHFRKVTNSAPCMELIARMQACAKEGLQCDHESMQVGYCVFSALCAKPLTQCMQGKSFIECFNDARVKQCIDRADTIKE